MVLIVLQRTKWFFVYLGHLRLYFLVFLFLFKSKYTNLTLYFSEKVTFISLTYIKGSMVCVFSPQPTLELEALVVKKGSLDLKTEFAEWGN